MVGHRSEVPAGYGNDGYVLSLPGRQHLIAAQQNDAPDVVAIIEEVQEWVMDELGRGWPELCDSDGNFVALLKPMAQGQHVVWSARGTAHAPVGELASLPIALPPRPT